MKFDFSTVLETGKTHIKEFTVKSEDTADYLGNNGITMLSTPAMIKYMEQAASYPVFKLLPDNFRPLGTKIDIEHINPTPVNSKIIVKSTLIAIEGNKLRYYVEAFNQNNKIGFGIYEQHIMDLEDFMGRHA